ncbi:MAG: hypothetical protein B7Z83_04830 [Thiomonas sp. 20-64-5]|nr:MAG: hypothetical protein B7Z83_04830 [Thiomonas sp. 20-64-5]
MPVAKPNPAAKTAKAVTGPARTARPAPRKTVTRVAKPAPAKAPSRKTAAVQFAAQPSVAKVAKPAAAMVIETKPPKIKLVRDSFTIPRAEYEALGAIKERLVKLAHPAKKSEVLRAGISVLTTLNDAALLAALDAVPAIKTGRPKKAK